MIDNLQENPNDNNPIRSNYVYVKYKSDTQQINSDSAPLEPITFGKMLKHTFPGVTCRSVFNPQKRFWGYFGLKLKNPTITTDQIFSNEQELSHTITSNGFHVITANILEKSLSIANFTDLLVDGQTILKEVTLENRNAVIKIREKVVAAQDHGISTACDSFNDLIQLMHATNNLRVCTGFELKDHPAFQTLSTHAGGLPLKKIWSRKCFGCTKQRDFCTSCYTCLNNLKQRDSEPNNINIHSDHSYCIKAKPDHNCTKRLCTEDSKHASSMPKNLDSDIDDVLSEDSEGLYQDDDSDKDPTFSPSQSHSSSDVFLVHFHDILLFILSLII
jgi:hypothetical protein